MNRNALRAYLSRFDIPVVETGQASTSTPLHFGVRIAADFVSSSPVISVFQGGDVLGQEYVSPLLGLRDYQARNLGNSANLVREYWDEFIYLVANLYRCYLSADALWLQLDDLMVTDDQLVAADCTIRIDHNAWFRQSALFAALDDEVTQRRHETGITYFPLKGQIGVVSNGSGLAMATMDLIAHYSDNRVRAANFLDIGNDLRVEKLGAALQLILSGGHPRAVLVTLFAAAQCAHAASILIESLPRETPPITVFFSGIDSEQARAVIDRVGSPLLTSAASLREAARRAIRTASGIEG